MGVAGDSLIKVTRERSSLLASFFLRMGRNVVPGLAKDYTAVRFWDWVDKIGNWKRGGNGLVGLLRFSPLGK
jgi:hypothetical protein